MTLSAAAAWRVTSTSPAGPSGRVGGRIKYEIDHMNEIQDGGGVYDMNNLIVRTG